MARWRKTSDQRNLPRTAVFLGGYCRFAAVTAGVFAASRRSWWRSSPLCGGHGGGLLHQHKNNAKIRFTCDFRLISRRNMLGVCASSRHLRRQAIFFGEIVEKKGVNKPKKKATSTGRGRWSCGGLRRAALEVTAVFCGLDRWLLAAVFLGFSIWRLKRHNLQLALVAAQNGAQE